MKKKTVINYSKINSTLVYCKKTSSSKAQWSTTACKQAQFLLDETTIGEYLLPRPLNGLLVLVRYPLAFFQVFLTVHRDNNMSYPRTQHHVPGQRLNPDRQPGVERVQHHSLRADSSVWVSHSNAAIWLFASPRKRVYERRACGTNDECV